MSAPKVEQISGPLTLGEGPHWDHASQALYFVDINGSTIHKYVPATKKHTKVKIEGGPVSIVIPLEGTSDSFVISVGRNIALMVWDGESTTPADVKHVCTVDNEERKLNNRINDGKADPSGRLWAGTLGPHQGAAAIVLPEVGSLFSFSKNWTPKTHLTNVTISNGLAWSEDNKLMYYIDSPTKQVDVFDFDINECKMSNRQTAFDFKKNGIEGVPDGMAIDTEGKLWVACFEGSQVIRVDPASGKVLTKISIPASQVTSVAFGGSQLDELFVTSASIFFTEEQKKQNPQHGCTFRITELGVKGYPGRMVDI